MDTERREGGWGRRDERKVGGNVGKYGPGIEGGGSVRLYYALSLSLSLHQHTHTHTHTYTHTHKHTHTHRKRFGRGDSGMRGGEEAYCLIFVWAGELSERCGVDQWEEHWETKDQSKALVLEPNSVWNCLRWLKRWLDSLGIWTRTRSRWTWNPWKSRDGCLHLPDEIETKEGSERRGSDQWEWRSGSFGNYDDH